MTAPHPRRGFDWDTAGRELGETLDAYHALVVVGVDPTATGRVAVALARAQAARRRVAVGDLFAESPPIQELVHSDDPHGLVDSFLYGVSLSRIAYEVPDAGQLFVMPSGTEPPAYEEIFPNPRWHRLAAGFREVGALLVLAAPASAPNIEDLVRATDGAVLVGEGVPRKLPVSLVVASVREPRPEPAVDAVAAPIIEHTRWSRRRVASLSGVALTLLLAAVTLWLAARPYVDSPGAWRRRQPKPDTVSGIGRVLPAVTPDTSRPAAPDSTPATISTITTPAVVNPADSAEATGYAVELMAANTQAGAILKLQVEEKKLQKDGAHLPAATFAPVLDSQGSRWFKVISGAYPTRAGADSLLAELRRRKVVDAGSGSIVELPFAFLIDSAVPAAAVPGMVASFADRGQPVYALRQKNGTAWLLVGAFESLDQSGLYAESLRASGVVPVLVYRKGRTF